MQVFTDVQFDVVNQNFKITTAENPRYTEKYAIFTLNKQKLSGDECSIPRLRWFDPSLVNFWLHPCTKCNVV